MPHFRLISVLFILLLHATPLQGQAGIGLGLSERDRIRVLTHAGERTAGTLMLVADEWIRLRSVRDLVREVPLTNVERLEVSLGRRRVLGTLMGAGAGLLGGVLVGAALSSMDRGGGGANMAVIGVPLIAIPAGAVLGAYMAPHRYVLVARPYRMTTPRDGRP